VDALGLDRFHLAVHDIGGPGSGDVLAALSADGVRRWAVRLDGAHARVFFYLCAEGGKNPSAVAAYQR
jgi:hypothetical protein